MKHQKTFFLILTLVGLNCYSQTLVTGIVKASDNNDPIPFAIIKNEQTKKLQASNEEGIFKVVIGTQPEKLSISSVGYQTTHLEINDKDSSVVVFLEPSTLNLGEVNVYASKSGMQASSLESLKNIETYSLSGPTKDIFRSVQMLPGVSSNNAASAQFNVRGGTVDENLMLINGIEVAEPYHIKVFPIASVGIFNIDMVQRIDFSSGGFSAEYGDALSSVMNVDYRKANNDSICGRINLGMVDLGILTELPINKKASLLVAGRHSYLDPVIKMIDLEEKVSIRYYDVQAKFDYRFNNRHEISVLGIYSQDYDKVGPQNYLSTDQFTGKFGNNPLYITQTEKGTYSLDSEYNDILFAIWSKHNIAGKLLLNSELSYYHEKENTPQIETDSVTNEFSASELFNRSYFYREDIKKYDLQSIEYKLSAKYMIAPNHSLKSGIYARVTDYDYQNQRTRFWDMYNNTEKYPDTSKYILYPQNIEYNTSALFKAEATKMGGYLSYQWQINSKFAINVGWRADYFSLNKQLTFNPRTNVSYSINNKWKINVALGLFSKTPLMKQLKYSYATKDNTKSQEAIHYIAGTNRKSGDVVFKIEAYYKQYNKLIPTHRSSFGEILYDILENNSSGYSTGIDFEYIVTKPKFNLWFIYSLCSAKEKMNGTDSYYSRYTDQTHTISSLFVFKMRNKKQFDIKITYGSGYAYRLRIYDKTQNQWVSPDPIQTKHLPYYLSIDLRFKKEFNIRSHPLQVYFDIMNILNRKNAIGHEYRINNKGPFEQDYSFLGIIPTFGVIFDF